MKRSKNVVECNIPGYDNRFSFFKLIKHKNPSTDSHSLRIPPKFVKTHVAKTKPSEATLKGPLGDYWKIKMSHDNEGNMVMMQQGWQKFYQHYSLGEDELLLFKHNGNLCFDVQIFGKNGVERKNIVPMSTEKQQDHSVVELEIKEE